jgi:hypothetical protein
MGNAENVSLNLDTGRIRVDVSPPAGNLTNFTVRSPNATASVRGTSFEFDTVNISVDEGRVIFTGNNGIGVIVTEGGESYVQTNSAAADPAEIITSSFAPPPPIGAPSLESAGQAEDTDGGINLNLIWQTANGGGVTATGP